MTFASDPDVQHVGTFWLLNITEHPLATVTPRLPVTFVRGGQELARAMGESDASEIQRRLAAGKWCYIGKFNDELVTYGWVTFDVEHIGELGLSIQLQPGEAYIWDCATPSPYRGQRLYPALLTYILAELQKMGLHRVWIGADSDNVASQKGMALAGFHPVVDYLLAQTPVRRFWLRGCPGASAQEIEDARYMLLREQLERNLT